MAVIADLKGKLIGLKDRFATVRATRDHKKGLSLVAPEGAVTTTQTNDTLALGPDRRKWLPDSFEAFGAEAVSVLSPDAWDGLRLEYQATSPNQTQQISTSVQFNGQASGYSVGAVSVNQDSGVFSLLRIDDQRNVLAKLCRTFQDGMVDLKALMNFNASQWDIPAGEVSAELCSVRKTADANIRPTAPPLSVAIKAAYQGTPLLSFGFTQVVTPSMQIGGEMVYLTQNHASTSNLGMRYTGLQDSILTILASRNPDFENQNWRTGLFENALRLSYVRTISSRLKLASQLELQVGASKIPESNCKLGYEYTLTKSRLTGCIGTDGAVGVALEEGSGIGCCLRGNLYSDEWGIGTALTMQGVWEEMPINK